MFGPGVQELIIIAIIIFLIFGAKKLPGIGKSLGGALREFKNIENELTGTGSKKDDSKETLAETNENKPSHIEAMVTKKLMGQIPGVRKVMFYKDKVDKVKKIIK